MKRTYFPGITDIVVVTDPAEIRTISNDSRLDRDFIGHGTVRNVQLLRKMLRIFSVNGRLFPTMLPRTDPGRAAAQDELWSRLNVKADEVNNYGKVMELLTQLHAAKITRIALMTQEDRVARLGHLKRPSRRPASARCRALRTDSPWSPRARASRPCRSMGLSAGIMRRATR